MRLSRSLVAVALAATLFVPYASPMPAVAALADPTPPAAVQRLVFVHHSTGEAWLTDGYGNLGQSLATNRYFVSDTNYGWGPDGIGSSTDVGHWWTWFRGPSASSYTSALLATSSQSSSYARSGTIPAGANTIVMFKSCFPNSNVDGSPSDAVPSIESNPLKGSSGPLTVGNAKGIYLDLLEFFRTQPDTMFVLIVSPPLRAQDTGSAQASNARYLANWLVSPTGWLKDYTVGNVVAWDYYTVLTGGHHRVSGGMIEHSVGGSNYLAYPTSDSHPSATGDRIATSEFVPFLNAAYRSWKAGTGANLVPTARRTGHLGTPWGGGLTLSHTRSYRWRGSLSPTQIGAGSVTLQIQHRESGRWRTWGSRKVAISAGATQWAVWQKLGHAGTYRLRAYHSDADHKPTYSSWRAVTIK